MAQNKAIVKGSLGELLEVGFTKTNRVLVSLSDDAYDAIEMIIEKDDFYKFIEKLQGLKTD